MYHATCHWCPLSDSLADKAQCTTADSGETAASVKKTKETPWKHLNPPWTPLRPLETSQKDLKISGSQWSLSSVAKPQEATLRWIPHWTTRIGVVPELLVSERVSLKFTVLPFRRSPSTLQHSTTNKQLITAVHKHQQTAKYYAYDAYHVLMTNYTMRTMHIMHLCTVDRQKACA